MEKYHFGLSLNNNNRGASNQQWVGLLSLAILFFAVITTTLLVQQQQQTASKAAASDATTPGKLTLAATYNSVSVYSNYSGDTNSNSTAKLEYRKVGENNWRTGMDMWASRKTTESSEKGSYGTNIDADGNWAPGITASNVYPQFRASLLMTSPNTDYEVKVTFSDLDGVTGTNPVVNTVRTRNENPPSAGRTVNVTSQAELTVALNNSIPGDNIIIAPGSYSGGFNVSRSGAADNWITIRAADLNNKPKFSPNIQITGAYIRLAGFEISGGKPPGIAVYPNGHDVIIEQMYIHNITSVRDDYDLITIGNGFSNQVNVYNVTVQDSDIHESGPSENENGLIGVRAAKGGHVFRRNKIIFDMHGSPSRHGTDCIAGLPNFEAQGGFLKDTDFYDNLCQGSSDDSIELDGGEANVRVWGNTIIGGKSAFSFAPSFFGPVYVFRNQILAFDKQWVDTCSGIKDGNAGQGAVFMYHNTFYGLDPKYCESSGWEYQALGFWIKQDGQDSQKNTTIKNNIIQFVSRIYEGGPKTADYNLIYTDPNRDNKYADWNGKVYYGYSDFVKGTGQDTHSINGKASFTKVPVIQRNGSNIITSFDADMRLASGSLGIDQAVIIPGFNDLDSAWPYSGTCPDMGAYEFSSGPAGNCGNTSSITPPVGGVSPTSIPTPTPTGIIILVTQPVLPTVSPTPTRIPTPIPTPVSTSSYPAGTYTVLGSQVPSTFDLNDSSAVELGVKFKSSSNGTITGVRYYKNSQTTGTHTGSLWTTSGAKLASATFTNETASGWQTAYFSSSVAISANTTYVASYFAPQGKYAQTDGYFSQAKNSGPLTFLANGTQGGNGVYRYGSPSGFPNSAYQSTNYWVDVLFAQGTTTSTPTVAPTPTTAVIPTTPPTPTTIPPTPTTVTSTGSTFGSTTVGASSDKNDSHYMNGTRFNSGSGGTVGSVSVYVGNVASAPYNKYQVAIYTNSNGNPGTLVAQSAIGTLVGNSWNTISVTVVVSPNTQYWLMYNTNGNSENVNNMRYTKVSTQQSGYASRIFGTWPSTIGSVTKESVIFSIYAKYK